MNVVGENKNNVRHKRRMQRFVCSELHRPRGLLALGPLFLLDLMWGIVAWCLGDDVRDPLPLPRRSSQPSRCNCTMAASADRPVAQAYRGRHTVLPP